VWNEQRVGFMEADSVAHCGESLAAILGFDFDNGSEWLNWTLIHYLQVRTQPIRLTLPPIPQG
jgi:hypothetical protein